MGKGILKSTGKILTAVILCFLSIHPVNAAELKAELAQSRIEAGDSTTLKVMISGTTSDIKPVKVPALDGLNINLSGTSRSFQFINGKSWTGIILNFTIDAEKKGVYRIPPFIIEADGEKLQTREFVLTVVESNENSSFNPAAIRGELELTAGEVYAGEPLLMRYYIKSQSSGIRIEGMKEQPESKGFVIKALKEENSEPDSLEANGKIYIASFCLVPAESGKHEIGGGILSVISESEGGFFSRIIRKEIHFPRQSVNVKALPVQGRPQIFNGDVGEFVIEAGDASGSFRKGDEIRIPVKVKGRGNLLMMSRLIIENSDGVKILVEENEPRLSVDSRTLTGEKDYTVTIIPEREGNCNIGRIYIPYFNPYKKIYDRAETHPFSFNITDAAMKSEASGKNIPEKESVSLPMIILFISIVLVVLCAILIYFQTGRYRIVRAEPLRDIKTEPEAESVDRKKFFRDEFERAYAGKDYKTFLLNVEKLTGVITDTLIDNNAQEELKIIKEKINLYRYGGASVSDEEITALYKKIKKLL